MGVYSSRDGRVFEYWCEDDKDDVAGLGVLPRSGLQLKRCSINGQPVPVDVFWRESRLAFGGDSDVPSIPR